MILGGMSIILCMTWVLGTSEIENAQQVAMAIFTGVTQGILAAGLSTYVNQIQKQINKDE